MAKKVTSFRPSFAPKPSPLGSQPVPTAPQTLKDKNQNTTKGTGGKKDK